MKNIDPQAKKNMTTKPEPELDSEDRKAAENVEEQRGEGRGHEPGKKKHAPDEQKTP